MTFLKLSTLNNNKLNIYKKPKHRSAYNQFQPEMATYSGKHSILPRNPRFGDKNKVYLHRLLQRRLLHPPACGVQEIEPKNGGKSVK